MDLTLPMSKSQRLVHDLDIVDSFDRISNLPDEVLCHILSYLPTKHAVATGILSKRWKYLWTLAPNLDFSDTFESRSKKDQINRFKRSKKDRINRFKMFNDYVDNVLFHRGGTTIKKCKFSFYTKYVAPYIYSWVCAVVCCNVQELTLKYRICGYQDLPWSLYTCKTLVVLNISGGFVLNLPTYFCFPSLKTLHLDSVVYGDDAAIKRLFSSCPILENLDICRRYCDGVDGVEILSISIPSLKILSIFSDMNEGAFSDYDYKTEINAPNLEYLTLIDHTWEDYSMTVSPSLVEAYIRDNCQYALLQGISHVKVLALANAAIKSLHFVLRDHGLPTFHYLTELELGVADFVDWKLLLNLLESSPNLEVLVFSQGTVLPKERGFRGFYWVSPESLPKCLLFHLKTIEVLNFVGMPGEVSLVKYFLESAKVLDRMMIHCYDSGARSRVRKKFKRVQEEILNAPRGSISCQVEFIN